MPRARRHEHISEYHIARIERQASLLKYELRNAQLALKFVRPLNAFTCKSMQYSCILKLPCHSPVQSALMPAIVSGSAAAVPGSAVKMISMAITVRIVPSLFPKVSIAQRAVVRSPVG